MLRFRHQWRHYIWAVKLLLSRKNYRLFQLGFHLGIWAAGRRTKCCSITKFGIFACVATDFISSSETCFPEFECRGCYWSEYIFQCSDSDRQPNVFERRKSSKEMLQLHQPCKRIWLAGTVCKSKRLVVSLLFQCQQKMNISAPVHFVVKSFCWTFSLSPNLKEPVSVLLTSTWWANRVDVQWVGMFLTYAVLASENTRELIHTYLGVGITRGLHTMDPCTCKHCQHKIARTEKCTSYYIYHRHWLDIQIKHGKILPFTMSVLPVQYTVCSNLAT